MTNRFFVIVYGPGYSAPWLLSLDGWDKKEGAERAIRWQHVGQPIDDKHHIATRTGPATFKTESGETIEIPERSPYTEKAWEDFKAYRR